MAGEGHFQGRLTHWGDILALVLYFGVTLCVAIWSMCRPNRKNVSGYFLAGRTISWWPIGLSIFGSNISSVHFIGLAGSGAASGLAVVLFEWHAAFLILLMAWVFLPVYMASEVFTLPQYMMKRFSSERLRVTVSLVFLITNSCASMPVSLYSGGLFIQRALGWNLYSGTALIIAFALFNSILGGLATVLYTDAVQMVVMIGGAFVVFILSVLRIGGITTLFEQYEHSMADSLKNDSNLTCGRPREDALHLFRDPVEGDYPWPGTLFVATFVGVSYWCANQTIVQRSFAAKSLSHAKAGAVLAGALKITPFFTMVVPGMIARVLYPNEVACADSETCMAVCGSPAGCSNIAYPKLVMEVLPTGLRGMVMAVMLSAVISTLTSMYNSIGTVITMDLWMRCRPAASTREQLMVGKVSMVVAALVPLVWLHFLHNAEGGQIFLYVSAILGYMVAPLSFIFLMAMLWMRVNEQGTFWGFIISVAIGLVRFALDVVYPGSGCGMQDTRPALVAKVHPYYFVALQTVIGALITVAVSLLTKPIPREKLAGLTFWTRLESPDQEDVDMSTVKQYLNSEVTSEAQTRPESASKKSESVAFRMRTLHFMQDFCGITSEEEPPINDEGNTMICAKDRLTEKRHIKILLDVLACLLMASIIGLYGFFN